MLERFKENVYYFFTGSVGLVLGLAPLVIIAVIIALLIERTNLVLMSPLESSQSQDLANSMLSLLVAFLVSKNIDANLMVHDAVDAVRTSSVELASLAYSVRSDACNREIDEIIEASLEFLDNVKPPPNAPTADEALQKCLRAIHKLKVNKTLEAEIVPVFTRAASTCYNSLSLLWSKRNLSGTPPSIKVAVYVTAVLNAAFVVSDLDVSEQIRISASIFVIIASIGAYAISGIVRDPLAYWLTSHESMNMVEEGRKVVTSLHANRCDALPLDFRLKF